MHESYARLRRASANCVDICRQREESREREHRTMQLAQRGHEEAYARKQRDQVGAYDGELRAEAREERLCVQFREFLYQTCTPAHRERVATLLAITTPLQLSTATVMSTSVRTLHISHVPVYLMHRRRLQQLVRARRLCTCCWSVYSVPIYSLGQRLL